MLDVPVPLLVLCISEPLVDLETKAHSNQMTQVHKLPSQLIPLDSWISGAYLEAVRLTPSPAPSSMQPGYVRVGFPSYKFTHAELRSSTMRVYIRNLVSNSARTDLL